MESVLRLLPSHVRFAALASPYLAQIEEFKLRAGQAVSIVVGNSEYWLPTERKLTTQDLSQVLEVATQGSVHTALDSIRQGFVTVQGGHRLGLGGTAATRDGDILLIRDVSSITIRVARDFPNTSAAFFDKLWQGQELQHTIILSPPGAGKTTVLRDIICKISDGTQTHPHLRVSIADERGELAASYHGLPQLAIGSHTDVLENCPKAQAVLMLLRAHGPQVIAVDEITSPCDVDAIRMASHCGVTLLATAHGNSISDLDNRPVYRGLRDLFQRVVLIQMRGHERHYAVERLDTYE